MSATQIRQDRQGGVTLTGSFVPAPDPTFALPLANGRGYWVIGSRTQSGTDHLYGHRPAAPGHAAVTLDGFFGWPLTATAS